MKDLWIRHRRHNGWVVAAAAALIATMGMALNSAVVAQDGSAAAATADVATMDIDQMTLRQLMERMSQNFRQLKRTVRDVDQRDAALGALIDMQRIAIAARQQQPPLDKVPEDQRSAMLVEFRVRLIALSGKMLDAERAVVEGRTTDAFDAVKEMAILEREGHEKFQVDEG